MSLDRLLRALSASPVEMRELTTRRAAEVHCRVSASDVRDAGDLACRDLGASLILMAADDRRNEAGAFFVHYLFAHPAERWFLHASAPLHPEQLELPSLAPFHYPASRFEREIRDLFGIVPVGHPDPRPLVKHGFWPADYFPLRKDAKRLEFSDDGQPFPFTEVGGEGVYEIPVGPVHAGVIEPGHFRFSVMGESVIDLKSRLYFTHKGWE